MHRLTQVTASGGHVKISKKNFSMQFSQHFIEKKLLTDNIHNYFSIVKI